MSTSPPKSKNIILLTTLLIIFATLLVVLGILLWQGGSKKVVGVSDKALIIVSEKDLSLEETIGNRNKLEVFRDIVRSNWIADVTVLTFEEVVTGMGSGGQDILSPYDTIFVIDVGVTPLPEVIQDLVKSSDKKTVFIGYNFIDGHTLWDLVGEGEITHKEVNFDYRGAFIIPRSILSLADFAGEGELKDLAHLKLSDGKEVAIITEAGNRLFVSLELPNYYETSSHTTVFLSTLADFLGCKYYCDEPRAAFLRLEDINPFTYAYPNHLRDIFSFLADNGAVFSGAIIPKYLNPPQGIELDLADSYGLVELLRDFVERGSLVLVQHGFTHQRARGESGIDSEFWDEINNSPVPDDSKEYVYDRVRAGREAMEMSGLPEPKIWETPHYALSELDGEVINSLYSYRYERTKEFGSLPFIFTRHYDDGSAVTYIPENVGFIEFEEDFQRIERELVQLSTVRGATPSLFWHPWRDIEEIKRVVDIFDKYGYKFVSPLSLFE